MVYADNAATTQLAPEALAAMMPYLQNEYGNASQPYSFSRSVRKALKGARETIAACINALPEEIYFTSGGTESDNWALKGIMYDFNDHRALVTSQIEHHAILHSATSIERMGYPVVYLPVDTNGTVLPETLETNIIDKTKLVSVMFSNNEIGTIQPIRELADIAHKHGALFHTDAVQAVGHVVVDIKELGVDLLSSSAHKFNGPKGVGFLYIKNGTKLHPFNDGGAQEFGMRAGTENVAAIVGMAEALKRNCECMATHTEHLLKLESIVLEKLQSASLVFLRNGSAKRVPGNMSLSFRNASGEMLLHRLDLMGICVSTGSACDSHNTQITHVLDAINLDKEYAEGTIRVSFGKDNTIEEAQYIADAIIKVLSNIG